nr:uncharacterized protein LOC107280309 [Oryza sativa Japonica Group]
MTSQAPPSVAANPECNIDEEDNTMEDPDFVDSDYEVDRDDDDLYDKYIDGTVHDELALVKGKAVVKEGVGNIQDASDDIFYSDERLFLPESSEDEGEIKLNFKTFRPDVDMQSPEFYPGMVFGTIEELRKAVSQYSITNRVAVKPDRNNKKRYEAHCAENCPWKLVASVDSRANCFMVKQYVGSHTCRKEWELKAVTARYLAGRFIEEFRGDDKMTLASFAKKVQKSLNITPSRHKLGRARQIAREAIYGDEIAQYDQLWDYAQELRRSNPGSKFFSNLHNGCFHTLYVSMDASKRGFLSGCRPLICFDGCHIKTKFGGHILTAVGMDPNDCIYPIAIAVVEVENRKSWGWFLSTLKEDLGIMNTSP